MRAPFLPALTGLAVLVAGCAGLACTPATVAVERKEERPSLRTETRGIRTDPTGRVREERREVIVLEYWVRADDRWYRVSESDYRAAEPGRPLSLCR